MVLRSDNVDKLVYFTETDDSLDAISFEKKIKGWKRNRKIELIEQSNPNWDDLSEGWDFSGLF